jgi:DNA-binding winged helix-turn-helix (wHTH) protein
MRFTFDTFTFDSERRELLEGAQPIHLGPKAFQLLELLIGASPRALSKKELYERIWPGTFVNESNLPGLVNELRSALGDRARKRRFIRTVHGFGYAFCCPVKTDDGRSPAAFVAFRGRDFPLHDGTNVLGRDPSADAQIDDSTVSRRHALIAIREDGVIIEDLDSKNGTFINATKVTGSAPLADRDTIVLGDVSLVFRRSRTPSSTVTVNRPPRR